MTEDTSSKTTLNECTDDVKKLNCLEVSAFHGPTCQKLITYRDWENSRENVTTSDNGHDQLIDYHTENHFKDSTSDYSGKLSSMQSVFQSSRCHQTSKGESLELEPAFSYDANRCTEHSIVGVKKSDSSDDTSGYNKELSGGVCDRGYVEEDSDDEEVFQRYSQQPRRRINSCASLLNNVSILLMIVTSQILRQKKS